MNKNRTYEPETLRRLQLAELEIFKDFAAICEKHEIPYFVCGGTAIGALRHGGFIPWDDDIDVCLLREDYDRLIELLEEDSLMMEKYWIVRADKTKDFPLMSTRLCIRGTKFKEWPLQKLKCGLGIFLDIFPYDHMESDLSARKKQVCRVWFWSKLYILCHIAFPILPFKGLKGFFTKVACASLHGLLVAIRISKKYIFRKYHKAATQCNHINTGIYTDFQHTFPEKMLVTEEEIYPLRKVAFEDTQVNVLNKAEDYLNRQFDDFMQLPPADKRKNHFPFELDFGTETQQTPS